MKILQTKLGRFLVVNVKGGTAKTAKVRIQILSKNGKVLKTVSRVVGVNKPVTLKNLKLPAAAASVRTSVTA